MKRPEPGDCVEYYFRYVDLVPDGDVNDALARQWSETEALFAGIDEERAQHRYAPDKWSLKEVVGHMVDCERIFATRALSIARGERQPLPGFEQDDYIADGDFAERSFASVVEEFKALRAANVALFQSLSSAALSRTGTVSDHPMKASVIPWILAGHELHHRKVIQERYL